MEGKTYTPPLGGLGTKHFVRKGKRLFILVRGGKGADERPLGRKTSYFLSETEQRGQIATREMQGKTDWAGGCENRSFPVKEGTPSRKHPRHLATGSWVAVRRSSRHEWNGAWDPNKKKKP